MTDDQGELRSKLRDCLLPLYRDEGVWRSNLLNLLQGDLALLRYVWELDTSDVAATRSKMSSKLRDRIRDLVPRAENGVLVSADSKRRYRYSVSISFNIVKPIEKLSQGQKSTELRKFKLGKRHAWLAKDADNSVAVSVSTSRRYLQDAIEQIVDQLMPLAAEYAAASAAELLLPTDTQLRDSPILWPLNERPQPTPEIRKALDHLSTEVQHRIKTEHRFGRVYDPTPIPVRWSLMVNQYTDHWQNIVGRERDGNGLPHTGSLHDVADLFRAIPSNRLVVLGDIGSGKTVMLWELVLGLLKSQLAAPGGLRVVLVPFSIAAWNPTKQSLHDWLILQVCMEFPELAKSTKERRSLATQLVRERRILPLLDGLDEIPLGFRHEALRAISSQLDSTDPMIIASRHNEFFEAIEESDVLTAAAVIWLNPLTVEDLAEYLPRTAKADAEGKPQDKWSALLARLQSSPDDPACRNLCAVLSTPQTLFLARSIYSETKEDPSELLDVERFPHRLALLNHLLDGFIPAIYARLPFKTQWEREREMYRFRWTMRAVAKSSYGNPGRFANLAAALFRWLRRQGSDLEDGVAYGVLKRTGSRYRIRDGFLREQLATFAAVWSWPMFLRRARSLELYADLARTHLMLGDPEVAQALYEDILHATRFRKRSFVRFHVQIRFATTLHARDDYERAITLLRLAYSEQRSWRGFLAYPTREVAYTLAAVLADAGQLEEGAQELRRYVGKHQYNWTGLDAKMHQLLRRIETAQRESAEHEQ